MYYDGRLRQRGGGLGDVFRIFARTIVPNVLRLGKNFVKQKATTLAPKALKAGVGVVKDMMGKTSFKKAIQQRGKRLLSEAINMTSEPPKRQKTTRGRTVKKVSRAQGKRRKKPPKKSQRNPDIFD